MFNNKRGQLFVVVVAIAVTLAIASSYFILQYVVYAHISEDVTLGTYQSGMVDTLNDADKVLVYNDLLAKYSSYDALRKFMDNGGVYNKIVNDDSGSDTTVTCGRYIYNLWNDANKNCYPEYTKTYQKYLDDSLRSRVSNVNSIPKYYPFTIFKALDYNYEYYSNNKSIFAVANDPLTLYVFKNTATKNNIGLQSYVALKSAASLKDGDITGVPFDSAVPSNYLAANNRKIDSIVIHYTAGESISSAMSRFKQENQASAHYIIGGAKDNYAVEQVVLDKDVAYHAGCINSQITNICAYKDPVNSKGAFCKDTTYGNINSRSIGIEIVNLGFDCGATGKEYCRADSLQTNINGLKYWQKYPDQQMDKIVALSAILVKKYGVSKDNIIGHDQITACKSDPGPAFDWTNFKSKLDEALKLDINQLETVVVSGNTFNGCPKTSNTDWKIGNLMVSKDSLNADDTLTVTLTIINTGDNCVNVQPKIYFTSRQTTLLNGQPFTPNFPSSAIFKKSDAKPYINIELKCKFTTDVNIANSEQANGNCVLLAPPANANVPFSYTVYAKASEENGLNEKTGLNMEKPLTVYKPKGTTSGSGNGQGITVSNDLSPTEKNRVDQTRQNLEKLNIIGYIGEVADKYQIPKELLMGKITQESSGINYKIKIDSDPKKSNYAVGISQIEGWQHYNLIKDTCGAEYVTECAACTSCDLNGKGTTCRNDLKNCCKFEKFGNDPKCQIDVGARLLKQEYDRYVYNYEAYKNNVMNSCKDPIYQQKYLAYTGWERALRAYNGFGCDPKARNDLYVDLVSKWASGWGYTGTYQNIVKAEVETGILGTYDIKPSYTTSVGFDFKILDKLTEFAQKTTKECGGADSKDLCVQDNIQLFNTENIPIFAKNNEHINLTTNCEDDYITKILMGTVREIDDCVNSNETECQCVINSPEDININLRGSVEGTTLTYNGNDKQRNVYSDRIIYSNGGLINKTVSLKDVTISKNQTGLSFENKYGRKCAPLKNSYDMCLKTDFNVPVVKNDKLIYENLTLKFSIRLRDDVPPDSVVNIDAYSQNHTNNSIILTWDKNPELDVAKYIIYLSDDMNTFNRPTDGLKSAIPYRVIPAVQGFDEYYDIDYQNPVCKVNADNTGVYCVFNVAASKAVNGAGIRITLEENKLYYLSKSNQFLYILNGSDAYNKLADGQDKNIAITAVDADGNEMKFINISSSTITVTAEDLLESGFTNITSYKFENNNNTLVLSWNQITKYINGKPLSSNTAVYYNVYMIQSPICSDQGMSIATMGSSQGEFNSNADNAIIVSSMSIGDYCVGVTSKTNNGREFDGIYVQKITLPAHS
jgi:N-acetyl-anhydromuramyl-L-alanine amidase AmpD